MWSRCNCLSTWANTRSRSLISPWCLAFDRRKGSIYAGATILEYWIVNLRKGVLEVHRDPLGGLYRSTTLHRADEQVCPRFQPATAIPLESFFPPARSLD